MDYLLKKLLFQTINTLLVFFFIFKFKLVNPTIDFSIINPIIKNSHIYVRLQLFTLFSYF